MAYNGGCLNYANNPNDTNNYWVPHENYSDHSNEDYNAWGSYHDDSYTNHHNGACTNHQNNHTNTGYQNYDSNYNTYTDSSHTDTGHSNGFCSNATYINNYNNHTNVHASGKPTSWPLRNGMVSANATSWTKLNTAIPDLKNLRDDITKISETKVKSDGTPITFTPSNVENADAQFTAGKKARAAQINETMNNLKTLWNDIQGNAGSGWPTVKTAGTTDKILKSDYRILIQKAQDLANAIPTYINHSNSGTNTNRTTYTAHYDSFTGDQDHKDDR